MLQPLGSSNIASPYQKTLQNTLPCGKFSLAKNQVPVDQDQKLKEYPNKIHQILRSSISRYKVYIFVRYGTISYFASILSVFNSRLIRATSVFSPSTSRRIFVFPLGIELTDRVKIFQILPLAKFSSSGIGERGQLSIG